MRARVAVRVLESGSRTHAPAQVMSLCEAMGAYVSSLTAADAIGPALASVVEPFLAPLLTVAAAPTPDAAHTVGACVDALASVMKSVSLPSAVANPLGTVIASVSLPSHIAAADTHSHTHPCTRSRCCGARSCCHPLHVAVCAWLQWWPWMNAVSSAYAGSESVQEKLSRFHTKWLLAAGAAGSSQACTCLSVHLSVCARLGVGIPRECFT